VDGDAGATLQVCPNAEKLENSTQAGGCNPAGNVAGELERRGSMPPAVAWFPQWRQDTRSGPNEDNDARGPSMKSEMITDVISRSYEFDDVLSREPDVRTQPVEAETSSDALVFACFV
jgi:hypothetical protein